MQLFGAMTLAQAQPSSPVPPANRPNATFNVERQTGSCPKTVSLWAFSYRTDFISTQTVVADTFALAQSSPQIVAATDKFVEYQAPLRQNYTLCIGRASSQMYRRYNFEFRQGNVYFRVDLRDMPDDFPSAIVAHQVVSGQPYVIWSFSD